jgi:hypothetical protein
VFICGASDSGRSDYKQLQTSYESQTSNVQIRRQQRNKQPIPETAGCDTHVTGGKKMMKKWMAIGMMAFAIVATDTSFAQAQDGFVDENGDGVDDGSARSHRHGRRGLRGVGSQLTETQRADVKAAIETLKASDATREEIQEAIGTMLEGFGVELPDRGDRIAQRLGSVLTEDQLAEVQAKIDELSAADASGSDIKAAVGTLLDGYGVEAPTRSGGLSSVLSEDQLGELRAEIDALRESDASREDIKAAFEAKLGEFGVDPSAIQNGQRGGRRGHGEFRGRRGGHRGPAPADAPAADDAS